MALPVANNATMSSLAVFTALKVTNNTTYTGALYTYPELIVNAVGFTILSCVAMAGNSLVLVAVARTKALQTKTNVFVVNLSVTDFLTGFSFLWSVPGLISQTPGYPLPWNVPCVVTGALVYAAVGCCTYTLAAIAVNRYVLITKPIATYQRLYTHKTITAMIVFCWLVPLSTMVVPPLFGIGNVGFDTQTRTCSDIDTHPSAGIFDKIQFAIFYPIPFIVITVMYVLIWRHVRGHFKTSRKVVGDPTASLSRTNTIPLSSSVLDVTVDPLSNGNTSTTTPATSLRRACSTIRLNRTRRDQLDITKNLFLIVCVFVLCFTPLAILVLTKSDRFQLYGGMILFVSSCINPIIYATRHPHFRPVLRSMVGCRSSGSRSLC